jgi:hypothetical protein
LGRGRQDAKRHQLRQLRPRVAGHVCRLRSKTFDVPDERFTVRWNLFADHRIFSTLIVQTIYGSIQEYGGFDRPEWLD